MAYPLEIFIIFLLTLALNRCGLSIWTNVARDELCAVFILYKSTNIKIMAHLIMCVALITAINKRK